MTTRLFLPTCTSLLLACLLGHARLSAQVTPDSRKMMDALWAGIRDQKPGVATRELPGYVLKAIALKADPADISAALALLPGLQDRDPASPTYGNFVWLLGRKGEKPNDLNAVQFTMENAILVWNLYRDSLSPGDQALLKETIATAAHGVRSQKIGPDYTNIFLMKTWNLIAIGEALDHADLAEEGYRMLDQWINYTRSNGITEYLGSTYLGVSIDPLVLIQKYARRSSGRERAQTALEFFYAYTRANWFAPAGRLGGAHGRAYDYLTGRGYFDKQAVDWGWIPTAQLSGADYYANPELTKWLPQNPAAPPEVSKVPRLVRVRFGNADGRHASQAIGEHVSLGVAGLCKGPEDQVFCLSFASDPKMAMVSYVMDGRNDPFGVKPTPLAVGTFKAHHLTPFVTSDQVGMNVLLFSSFGPFVKLDPSEPVSTCLNSHLLLPLEAPVLQGGKSVQIAMGGSTAIDGTKPIFVRHADVAVGIRVLDATSDKGQAITPTLCQDHEKPDAQRITWIHASQAPAGEAHLALLISVAEKLDEEGFVRFQKQFSECKTSFRWQNNRVVATADTIDRSHLSIDADAVGGQRRSGQPEPKGIFEVNGTELGQSMLVSSAAKR